MYLNQENKMQPTKNKTSFQRTVQTLTNTAMNVNRYE